MMWSVSLYSKEYKQLQRAVRIRGAIVQTVRSASGEGLARLGALVELCSIMTHITNIVLVAVGPNQIKIILKLFLRFVLLLLNLLGHGMEVHSVRDNWICGLAQIRHINAIHQHVLS